MLPSSRRTAALALALSSLLLAPREARADDDDDEIARAREEFVKTYGDRPIAAIRVEGLRRTRLVVVRQWIDCAVGQTLSTCDVSEIRERLYRLAIFSEVGVELNDGPSGVEIVFRLEDKWTLYPVPMLWYTSDTQIAGLVVAEANLLGYNKGLALGGVYSNRGWYTLAGYNDPNIAFTDLWGQLHTFLGNRLVENDRPDGSIEQSFDLARFDFEWALGWTFWDHLSPSWTGAFRRAHVGDVHVAGDDPAVDATVLVQGFNLLYSDRRYRDLYDEGVRVSAEVQHAFPLVRSARPYDDGIFDLKWAFPAPLDGFVQSNVHAFVGAMPVVFEERLGGIEGSRTLPGSGLVAADRYATLSVAYQVPIFSIAPGTTSALVFGEVGRYARNEEAGVTYGGPGAGVRFYLKRVAIPAVGVDVGYELGSRRVAYSIAIGYRPLR